GEDHKRGAPGQRCDSPRDAEAACRAGELSRDDVAVDAPALRGGEPIADERGNYRTCRCRDSPEEDTCEHQATEARRGGTPDHRGAPEHDRAAEQTRPRHAVGEDDEGEA